MPAILLNNYLKLCKSRYKNILRHVSGKMHLSSHYLLNVPRIKMKKVGFFLNNNMCNFIYICSSDSMSVFTLPVYVSEQNELFH